MKHLTTTLITLTLAILLLGACVPVPAAPPASVASTVAVPAATSPSAPADDWQTFTDVEVGFSIQIPGTWSSETLPDQNDGTFHGMAFTGPEGGVEVYWGAGFGGGCPKGTVPVQLAQGEVSACHSTMPDGTEVWEQMYYRVEGGKSFAVRAYTSDTEPASDDLVVQVLSTLTFMPPAAGGWQTYTDAEAGFSIQIPQNWESAALPDQNDGAIHGTVFLGPEGVVDVYWGVGFGGACPSGTEPVQLAQGELPACHTTNSDGTETWSQIGYEVSGGNSFSVRAYTSDAQPSSHDLVLQVLATLTFMAPAQPQAGAARANPASENCVKQGGTLSIMERGDDGQYGICTFEDNRQCEEWALLRGDCPIGGVKVTGYVTPAAQYCAITGGTYAVTGNGGADDEQGTCTFKDGAQCDAWDYYNGKCDQSAATADPLPSWNPGPAKDTILKFVADVADPASPSYVPPANRIAVTDNDGTLWTEKPIPAQAAFVFARIAQMAPDHPEWQTTQPYQAVLEQDAETLQNLSAEDVEKLIFTTHAGMTEEEFEAEAKAFLDTAKHPRFGVPYTETVYQPMLELLAFLRANDFKTFIVSGGGVEFMRTFSEEVYGIPRENVVGSSLQYEFQHTSDGSVLVRQPELVSFDDREMKPVNIQLHIGRRPILAVGNSDGDLAMFQYTGGRSSSSEAGKVPFLNLLLVHDDAEREYDYLTGTDEVMTAAAQSPWMFVSMERDFKTVFP